MRQKRQALTRGGLGAVKSGHTPGEKHHDRSETRENEAHNGEAHQDGHRRLSKTQPRPQDLSEASIENRVARAGQQHNEGKFEGGARGLKATAPQPESGPIDEATPEEDQKAGHHPPSLGFLGPLGQFSGITRQKSFQSSHHPANLSRLCEYLMERR